MVSHLPLLKLTSVTARHSLTPIFAERREHFQFADKAHSFNFLVWLLAAWDRPPNAAIPKQ
jgi:hypothetical protein